ncbi:MAG: TetR/AcrR family transcriptional regulator C-terminal domain-containing protein [Clostridiales bacterium]|nr:TetR/AcrR family transcriptional regulator C-terminal domain-containing protein [Clostridiales bacterium]
MEVLSDSNITKRSLASALKELMEEMPFAKITVADICEKCGMNRKSFYYHFRDKYDLVNWIYDTEFTSVARSRQYASGWDRIADLCAYFYENRRFYCKVLAIQGQNSFSDHFRELIVPVLEEVLRDILPEKDVLEFHINFFSDAFICALERWLRSKNSVPPEEFIALLRSCIQIAAARSPDF